jgi:hypothetical protein
LLSLRACATLPEGRGVGASHASRTSTISDISQADLLCLASWAGSRGRFRGFVGHLSSSCHSSLVEFRPRFPLYTLARLAWLCALLACGASSPLRRLATRRTLRGLMVAQTNFVPSRKYAPTAVRIKSDSTALLKRAHYPPPSDIDAAAGSA